MRAKDTYLYVAKALKTTHTIPRRATGESGERPLGIPHGPSPRCPDGVADGLGADIKRRIRGAQLGFRPHRGCKDALRRMEELLKAGYTSIVDADLKSGFDTIRANVC